MKLSLLQQFFAEDMVQAACWTLIHSLWQGLLLAVVCGGVIILTKKSSSLLRYNLLSILFFLFLLVAAFTFVRELKLFEKNNFNSTVAQISNGAVHYESGQQVKLFSLVSTGQSYIHQISNYLNTHASLIVAIWFIIFSARFVKMLADIGYAHRIRYYKTQPANTFWQERLNDLATQIGIKKNILLLQSEIVKVPMMTGFIKPVVLFPFGMMMQLPPEQVEAVLLHELAHIRRKDYLVNLAQSFSDAIFFFNPGVLWISSLIREERENCCDDIAINHTKNKKHFIHALVAFQEYHIKNADYAMAFPGKKNQLLQRVKRILQNDNKTLSVMQKVFLTSALVIAGLLTVVFAQNHKEKPISPKSAISTIEPKKPVNAIKIEAVPKEVATISEKPESLENADRAIASVNDAVSHLSALNRLDRHDTLPQSKVEYDDSFRGIIEDNVDGKKYEIVFIHGKATELYIDDKRIPDAQIPSYQNTIDRIVKAARDRAAKSKMDAERAYVAATTNKIKAEDAVREAERRKMAAEDAQLQVERATSQSQDNFNQAKRTLEADLAKLQSDKLTAEAAKEKMDKDKAWEEDKLKNLVGDLASDGIIKDQNKLSFSLNKNEFIVNGKKQPQNIFSKYKNKYLPNDASSIEYSHSGSETKMSYQEK